VCHFGLKRRRKRRAEAPDNQEEGRSTRQSGCAIYLVKTGIEDWNRTGIDEEGSWS
jgi:hypothetical protein